METALAKHMIQGIGNLQDLPTRRWGCLFNIHSFVHSFICSFIFLFTSYFSLTYVLHILNACFHNSKIRYIVIAFLSENYLILQYITELTPCSKL